MLCKHCGFRNGEDDHRCLRCGRRIAGVVVAAPPEYVGATALAPSLLVSEETAEFTPVANPPAQTAATQPTLFSTSLASVPSNIIPFERRDRQPPAKPSPAARPADSQSAAPPRTNARKPPLPPDLQGSLDFVQVSPPKSRKLKTEVEAQIFCDQPVATPTHRLVAAAIDGAIILFGFGLMTGVFELMGGNFGSGKMVWVGLGGAFALVSLFYGLIWAIAGRETAGMHFTDLQLITFDGFPLDGRSRALRFATTWLSFCSGGLGLLWAVADEENLTWHDHISKTFPTIREVPGTFVKQRR
jgi:uncharacterized RDD family membrane protein YckC